MALFGGIEAGGTKFVCAVGSCPSDLRDEIRFPTTTPDETIGQATEYFKKQAEKKAIQAIGIGSFGPVDPHKDSSTWGYITSTPKSGWQNTDFAQRLKRELGIPVGFDTDVNAAALGEQKWGAARGLTDFIYMTIGTGIGGGGMVQGRLMHGLMHPEMGHVRIPRRANDIYKGKCPFHHDCFEGMASGPAVAGRWGVPAQDLPPGHKAWELEAHYIALGLVNFICVLSPQRIILGGGIMEQEHLFPMIREKVQELLHGYVQVPEIIQRINEYIVPPVLGNKAGILGSIALAVHALP